jgi:hypothetical protein
LLEASPEAGLVGLESGKYRLYSRKIDPRTGKRRNLGVPDARRRRSDEVQAFQRK